MIGWMQAGVPQAGTPAFNLAFSIHDSAKLRETTREGIDRGKHFVLHCFQNELAAANRKMERGMKPIILAFICITGLALGQDKPRVFVQGKGSQDVTTSGSGSGGTHWGSWGSRSTVDFHDESMEVTKDLQKDCSGVVVTLNQSNADYTVMLNRESKHNRGLLRSNSQVQVANRLGDILGTNATKTVGNAAKDACRLILADWSQHGRIGGPDSLTSAPASAPVVPVMTPLPTEAAKVGTVSAVEPQPTAAAPSSIATVTKPTSGPESLGDAATSASSPARLTGEATAEISSDPLGADIEIDGNFVGSTPSSVGLAAGEHILRVSKNGYKRWERTLKSSMGNIKVVAALEPMPVDAAGTAHATDEIRQDPVVTTASTIRDPVPPEEILIGVWCSGNPTVRHDGVEISAVLKGPADNIDIRPGDVILAINGHFVYTIDELRAELLRHQPGERLPIQFRHDRFVSENYLILGSRDAVPRR
jgi:hypothetical protein